MKMFCSAGGETTEPTIFQCPMMTRFGLGTESSTESASYQRRRFNFSNSFNGLNIPTSKFGIDIKHCNNINNNNNNIVDSAGYEAMKLEANGKTSHCQDETGVNDLLGHEASPRMNELLQGLNEPGDSNNPPETPPWLDRELFDRGRKFYEKYLFSIFFSDLLSLLMMFSIKRVIRPLIYTDKSDTPIRALRRYVSTIMHVITWYRGDVWDPNDQANKDILKVRSIHNKSADIFNSSKNFDKMKSMSVQDKGHVEPSCPFSSAVRRDLQTQVKPGVKLESDDVTTLYISQWDMVVTQYSFLGMILAHPYRMGAWYVTEKELEGLVHFWRGIGWLLGIEDKYNFCSGSLAETKALCYEMEKMVMKPALSKADWNHEHMSASLIDGINFMVPFLSFPAMFRFLTDTLELSVPSFVSQMNFHQSLRYWMMRLVFHILFVIPGVLYIFNELLKLALRLIQDQSPSWFPKSQRPNVIATPYDYT